MIQAYEFIDKNEQGNKERRLNQETTLVNKLSADEINSMKDKINEIKSNLNPLLDQDISVKSINNFILPDLNGNAVIPDASLNQKGLIAASGTTQTFGGRKIIRGDGNTSNILNSFEIQNSLGVIGIRVADNNWVISNDRVFFKNSLDFEPAGSIPFRIQRNGNKLDFGSVSNPVARFNFDCVTGNMCVGQIGSQLTTNARLEVISIDKVSVPFPKMTNIQRLAISGTSLVFGGGVYVTDGGLSTEGIWIYKSNGWAKLI